MDDLQRAPVVIETSRYRIRGLVAVPPESRLSDYANESGRDFFAVTEAQIAPLENPDRERRVGFILVARHEVGVILPGDEEEHPLDPNQTRERTADHLWSFLEN